MVSFRHNVLDITAIKKIKNLKKHIQYNYRRTFEENNVKNE